MSSPTPPATPPADRPTLPATPSATQPPTRPAASEDYPTAVVELLAMAALARAILRRELRGLLIWAASLGLLAWYSVDALRRTYGTPELLRAGALLDSTPGVAAFTGPGYGLSPEPTLMALVANEVLLYIALGAAVYAILLVVRHTRATEENGLADLVRAGAMRPGAESLVVLLVLDILLTALGAVVAVALLAGGAPLGGAIVFAGAGVAVGSVLGSTALAACQLAPSARSARAWSFLALLLAFWLRAVGDVARASGHDGAARLSLLSPIGWAQASRPWTGNDWWWMLILLVVADGVAVLAWRLSSRRDIGTAALALPEPPEARRPGPRGVLALTLRTHAAAIGWWVLAAAATSALYGSLTGSIADALGDLLSQSQYLEGFVGGALTARTYLETVLRFLVLIAGAAGVALVLGAWSDELDGRADAIVAAPVPRSRRLLAAVTTAGLASLLALAASGVVLGGLGAVTSGEPGLLGDTVLGALAAWSACLVLVGAAALAVGAGRAAAAVGWAVFGAVAVVDVLADVLDLPQWVRDISPFSHVPGVLVAGGASWWATAVLAVLAAGLVAAGAGLVARRDLVAH